MAEYDYGTDDLDPGAGASEQTDLGGGVPAAGDDGTTPDPFSSGEVSDDPNDPQYKRWQAAYTRSRQRDRERYGKMEQEHQQFGQVLRDFYASDEYALQVLRQRFPQLAGRLTTDGAPAGPQAPPTSGNGTGGSVYTRVLARHLGTDLEWLAPRLAPAIEELTAHLVGSAVRPLEQRDEQRQVA